jgi:hypothetical protein
LFFENLDTLIILKIREKYIAKNNQLNEDEELLNVIEKKIYIITTTSKGDNEIFISDKSWKFESGGVSSQSYGISS